LKTIDLQFELLPATEMTARAEEFASMLQSRRTVRDFSAKTVASQVIEKCLLAAVSAPSGANRQPWHFAVVTSKKIKKQIRQGAEKEEAEFYQQRAPQDWLDALAPLGTDSNKPFLEKAPYLIVIFGQKFGVDDKGNKQKNYYVTESVSIATGMLITALHNAGLATLTHTPSPMKFLNKILQRPANEKPLLILVVGYPEPDAKVPDIVRKPLSDVSSWHQD